MDGTTEVGTEKAKQRRFSEERQKNKGKDLLTG